MKGWAHPHIANPTCALNQTDDIAAEAKAALERRQSSYGELVRAGRLSAEVASSDLKAWGVIAQDWHWIAYGEGKPAGPDTLEVRVSALETALNRWLALMQASNRAMRQQENLQGACLCALCWWASQERIAPWDHIRRTASIGHDMRRRLGLPTRGVIMST